MKKIKALLAMGLFMFWAQPALAYIDPGSGSAIMSAVIGFFVAVSLGIKTYWYKLKAMFSSKNVDNEALSETKEKEQEQ